MHKVIIPKSGVITIGGEQYPVSSVRVTAVHNDIPYAEVGIVVDRAAGEEGSTVSTVSLQGLDATYKSLDNKVSDKEGRVSSMDVTFEESSGAPGQGFKFSLENWLLTGVGLKSHAAGDDGVNLYAVIHHPAHEIREHTAAIIGSALYPRDAAPDIEGGNVLAGAIDALRKRADLTGNESYSDIEIMKAEVRALADALDKHITWEGYGWPDKVVPGAEKAMRKHMYSEVVRVASSNPWNWISQTLCEQWGASFISKFWRPQLEMGPFEPWYGEAFDIHDSNIVRVNYPSRDPSTISGVYIPGGTYTVTMDTTFLHWIGALTDKAAIAGGLYHEEDLPGAIVAQGLPSWVSAAIAGHPDSPGFPDASYLDQLRETGEEQGHAPDSIEYQENAIKACEILSKYFFSILFRAGKQVALQCSLMLTDTIAPGMQAQISSGENPGDEIILKFFVTSVIHEFDCSRGVAGTVINGNYVRAPGGVDNADEAQDGTTRNQMYY